MAPIDPRDARERGALLRAEQRHEVDWRCTVRCADWRAAECIAVQNVSQGGMFLRMSDPPPIGSVVKVTVEPPDGSKVELSGKVRHVNTPGMSASNNRPVGVGVEIDPAYHNELLALAEIARIRQGKPPEAEAPPPAAPRPHAEAPRPPPAQAGPPRSAVDRPAFPGGGAVADILGIDFGATYSSVAAVVGEVVGCVQDEGGRAQIPSLLFFPEGGDAVVGWEAREEQQRRPDRAIPSIKRLLGHGFSEPEITALLHLAHYRSLAGPGDAILVEMDGKKHAVPQLCALILGHLKQLAERGLGREVSRAVLTHPVTFTEAHKQALGRAAQIAGIEVVKLIEEPFAAALAYGCGGSRNEIVAVYDFGGGTFDFTVLDISGEHHRVLVSDGDTWLGGDDFDRKLAEAMANAFWRRTNIELRDRAVEWQRLLLAAEAAKCALSSDATTLLQLPQVTLPSGEAGLSVPVDRQAFERVCGGLFDASLEICNRALSRIGLEPRDVTQVIISGGTCKIPFVRRGLERYFERQITEVVSTTEAVATGAAVCAAGLVSHPLARVRSSPT